MNDKILILFSGGVDSTGALYKALTDPQYIHLDIYAHHVHIINRLNRYIPEAMACENIVNWLRAAGHDFKYTESTIDFTKLFPGKLPYDTEICWSIAALIAQQDKQIKYATTGRKVDDSGPAETDAARQRLDTLFNYMTNNEWRDFGVNNLPIVGNMYKWEIWQMLPESLREMCWYCSNPIPESVNDWFKLKPCGTCHTCEDMNKVFERIKNE